MSQESWRRIEDIFHAALEHPPDQREAFVDGACGGNADLRSQVELLLSNEERAGSFLERNALDSLIATPKAAGSLVGREFGSYRIVSLLGSGGMGEVWKARDTRLDRAVAIKVSRSEFTPRFENEARAIAALNHPHICRLYDVGPGYLVMEVVEGEPVKGPLHLSQALKYGVQLCDALDTAHRMGIVHRDLKPANILVTKDGIKLLDFGLAKQTGPLKPADASTHTVPGQILGTPHYMSPEQCRGETADARSDLFSFGCVFYEMITGKRAFDGSPSTSVLAAILERPAPSIGDIAPVSLDHALRRCLAKDPEDRWQSARDLKAELEWISADAPSSNIARSGRWWQGIAGLTALVAVSLAASMFWPRAAEPAHRITFEVPVPDARTSFDFVSISPDGRKLVATGGESQDLLWIRDLETLEWRPLPGTEGATSPFWSPDGRFLAFGARNQLRKIDVSGGPPQTLCTVPAVTAGSGAWNRGGVILFGSRNFGSGGPLWQVSQAGGTPTPITSLDAAGGELSHSQPTFLPDGRHFLYFRLGAPEVEGVYAGSLDSGPGEQSRMRILAGRFAASYVNGYLFFVREKTLMAQPFDADRFQLRAEPVPMAADVITTWYNVGVFSVSPGGALAYRAGTGNDRVQLTWLDPQGRTISTFGQPSTDAGISLSPDGTRGLVLDNPSGPADVWVLDFARGLRTRLTFGARTHLSYAPSGVWSPDGSRIVFAAGSRLDALYEKPSSGAGEEKELLREPNRTILPTSWSRDGRFLLYVATNTPKTGDDLWVLPLQGNRRPVLLLNTVFNEWAATFSPDMRWIAYNSNETGRSEIYVRPFLPAGLSGAPSLGEGKWQVTKDGGRFPKWRADGREIFFEDVPVGAGKMAVEVKTIGPAVEYGTPRQLFRGPGELGDWAVTPDGKRFLVGASGVRQPIPASITVVLNWQANLKK